MLLVSAVVDMAVVAIAGAGCDVVIIAVASVSAALFALYGHS